MIRKMIIAALMLVLFSISAHADIFVSYNGQFYFTYPDSWAQVDFQTADYFLSRGDPDVMVDFEAVFTERATLAIFQGQYLVLTVDTVGQLSPTQVDSVMARLVNEFKREIVEVDSLDFLGTPQPDAIAYDRTNGLVAIETEVSGDDLGSRTNVLVMKFYEGGIANFYFYAPTPEYATNLPAYRAMVTSFSTENWESAIPSETVEVADIDNDSSTTGRNIGMVGGLFVILLVILATRMRSRAKKS